MGFNPVKYRPMSLISIFIVSFAIALSGALAPGPLLTVVIYESTRKGAKAGPLIILGHALLELLMVGVIILGLAQFINQPLILKTISLGGGGVLFYFGIKMIISAPKIIFEVKVKDKPRLSNLTATGIFYSLINPYWTIWWLTIGLGLVLAAAKIGLLGIGVFFIGHILADFLWYSIVSLTISRGQQFLSLKIYRGLIFTCGLLLILFAAIFTARIVF